MPTQPSSPRPPEPDSANLVASAQFIAEISERTRRTFRCDLLRGGCGGILETGWQVFALLLAVRVFHASPEIKASIAAASAYGLLLTPLSLFLIARTRMPVAKAGASFLLATSLCIVVATFAASPAWFFFAIMLSALIFAQHVPLMVHIYSENYSAKTRGSRLSNSMVLSVAAAGLFSHFGGRLLDYELGYYPLLLGTMAGAAALGSFAIGRMPSTPLPNSRSRNPLANISYIWKDRMFGLMLGVWMLMGLGALITIPLRVEYMANPTFGVDATNAQIALVIAVIPYTVRLVTTHFWGYLFDRLNFVVVRTMLNSCSLVSILLFFNTTNLWILAIAGAIFGFSTAGGKIAWSLWVTKLAPTDKVASYMSVHTFCTGLRGVVAPYIGFYLISAFSPELAAMLAMSLIAVSIVLLIPIKSRW